MVLLRGAETCRLNDPVDGSAIVELRSTGLQTVIGPSTHPDLGGQYDLLQKGEPASVPYEELQEELKCIMPSAFYAAADVVNEPNDSQRLPVRQRSQRLS